MASNDNCLKLKYTSIIFWNWYIHKKNCFRPFINQDGRELNEEGRVQVSACSPASAPIERGVPLIYGELWTKISVYKQVCDGYVKNVGYKWKIGSGRYNLGTFSGKPKKIARGKLIVYVSTYSNIYFIYHVAAFQKY